MNASEGTSNAEGGSGRSDAPGASGGPGVPEAPDRPHEPDDEGEQGGTGNLSAVPRPRSADGTSAGAASESPASESPAPESPAPKAPAHGVHAPESPAVAGPAYGPRPSRTGVAALSLPYRLAAAVVVAVVAVVSCVHLVMVFLHVAPPNTVTKQHGAAIGSWIYPEFEQNWKLFAPNPLQQNIAVEVRAEVGAADGTRRTTGWYGLSAADGMAIDHNPVPSHTQQNELRRSWDFFVSSHDDQNRPSGLRGQLSEQYLRRIVTLRLARADIAGPGGTVARIQIRCRTTNVPPPEWSDEQVPDKPAYRTLPWWQVPAAEGSDR